MEGKVAGPVVAVDIDEVIGAFLPAAIKWHNATYGTVHSLSDFKSYRFADTWGGSDKESTDKIHEFFKTEFFTGIEPVPGALEVLEAFRGRLKFVVVTSRQHVIRDATLAWLAKHYPGVFEDALFGNHWTTDSPDPDARTATKRTKKEMCTACGAIAIIDDNIKYARECAESDTMRRVILFGKDYGWNQGDVSDEPKISRASSWEEVGSFLEDLVA